MIFILNAPPAIVRVAAAVGDRPRLLSVQDILLAIGMITDIDASHPPLENVIYVDRDCHVLKHV